MDSLGMTYTLQSNASKKLFPENNASRFKVKLPMELHLTEDYAVALKEIHFPLSFKGVKGKYDSTRQKRAMQKTGIDIEAKKRKIEEDLRILPNPSADFPDPTFNNNGLISVDMGGEKRVTYVQDSYFKLIRDAYRSAESDVEKSEKTVAEVTEKCKVDAVGKANMCNAKIEKEQEKTRACENKKEEEVNQLRELLRVQRSTIAEAASSLAEEKKNSEFWRNSYISFTQQVDQITNKANGANIPRYLYIYSDLVEMRFLGDTYANFLHVSRVPPISMSGDTAVDRINTPQYARLENHHFDTIEIAIKDERGDEVHFEDGTVVIITLHFTRIR